MAKQIRLKDKILKIESCEKCPIKDFVFLCGRNSSNCTCIETDFDGFCWNCPMEDAE